MSDRPPFVRLNVAFGLIAIVLSLLVGALMGAQHDIDSIYEFINRTGVRRNNIENAHVHFGVIGIVNIVLGFILPWTRLARSRIVSWTSVASAFLVAAGFVLDDPALRPANEYFMYLRAAGFVTLTFAVGATLWNLRTEPPQDRS